LTAYSARLLAHQNLAGQIEPDQMVDVLPKLLPNRVPLGSLLCSPLCVRASFIFPYGEQKTNLIRSLAYGAASGSRKNGDVKRR
jgi:hypothetical protein